jgi:uncharacterized protein (TIGR04255 family)
MATSPTRLPKFERPPVVEMALDLQFDLLPKLRTPWLSLFWGEVRSRFPRIEEHSSLPPLMVESFDQPTFDEPRIELTMLDVPPVPRLWFVNEDGSELIQVQQNRFIVNWRRVDQGGEYPRYDHVRRSFAEYVSAFKQFVEREELGAIRPNQCAVTYYNQMEARRGWTDLSEAYKIFAPLRAPAEASTLPQAEDAKVALRFVIRDDGGVPLGRLYAELQPAFRKTDGLPMYMLTLTARGEAGASDIDGVLDFFDRGHEWAARAFVDLTTPEIQQIWEAQR